MIWLWCRQPPCSPISAWGPSAACGRDNSLCPDCGRISDFCAAGSPSCNIRAGVIRHTRRSKRRPYRRRALKAQVNAAIWAHFKGRRKLRLENWGARRRPSGPYFLRSFMRGSRVRKPAALRAARKLGVDLQQSAGHAVTDGAGLAGHAAAGDGGNDVHLAQGVGSGQGAGEPVASGSPGRSNRRCRGR